MICDDTEPQVSLNMEACVSVMVGVCVFVLPLSGLNVPVVKPFGPVIVHPAAGGLVTV